jgi:hypothetical protein
VTRRTHAVASIVLGVSLAGCAAGPSMSTAPSPTPLAATPGPSASATPPASPSPAPSETALPVVGDSFGILSAPPAAFGGTITCTGPIGATDPVAIVDLLDGRTVLRDYADPAHPRTACVLGTGYVTQLIDPNHIVIEEPAGERTFAVVDLPEVRFHWFRVSMGEFGNALLAVSPGLDEVAWNEVENGEPFDRIHLATAGGDRVVAKLPDTNPGRCGAPTDSNRAAYTRSGSALFVLDEPLPEISLIVVKDGALALSLVGTAAAATATRPLKALWSPTSETLYFTQAGAVWRWTQARGRTVFLPGVTWQSATIAPDGRHLAYSVDRSDGLLDTYLVDLAHGGKPVRIGNAPHGGPVFLDATHLYVVPGDGPGGCTGPGAPGHQIYDIVSGAESATDIDWIQHVWPATATHN